MNAIPLNPDDKLPSNYISSVQNGQIVIERVQPETALQLSALGARAEVRNNQTVWILRVADDRLIADLLSSLRDLRLLFVGGASGWPPAEVFADLRSQGLVVGEFDELVWSAQGKWRVRKR